MTKKFLLMSLLTKNKVNFLNKMPNETYLGKMAMPKANKNGNSEVNWPLSLKSVDTCQKIVANLI